MLISISVLVYIRNPVISRIRYLCTSGTLSSAESGTCVHQEPCRQQNQVLVYIRNTVVSRIRYLCTSGTLSSAESGTCVHQEHCLKQDPDFANIKNSLVRRYMSRGQENQITKHCRQHDWAIV
jgi:hypothetical protein